MSIQKILKQLFISLMVLIIGFFIGRIAGKYFITKAITGTGSTLFLYRLPLNYIYTANLLSSENELKRLEGYYSLFDYKIIDTNFLIQRYKKESNLIKPTIIWLIGYSRDKDIVLEFLSEEYKGANQRIKQEILKTMKKIDESFFNNFVNYSDIDKKETSQ